MNKTLLAFILLCSVVQVSAMEGQLNKPIVVTKPVKYEGQLCNCFYRVGDSIENEEYSSCLTCRNGENHTKAERHQNDVDGYSQDCIRMMQYVQRVASERDCKDYVDSLIKLDLHGEGWVGSVTSNMLIEEGYPLPSSCDRQVGNSVVFRPKDTIAGRTVFSFMIEKED